MRTLLNMPILRVSVLLATGVLISPGTEAICYTKETLLPIRKPVGADLFEIDPGAEVIRDIHTHVSSKQTTCKNMKTCFKLRKTFTAPFVAINAYFPPNAFNPPIFHHKKLSTICPIPDCISGRVNQRTLRRTHDT